MYFATGAALTAALNALPTSLTGTYKAFDAFYYADKYMGSYTGTLSPIEHFVQVGAARGYKPNADFDPTYYQSKFADLANLDAADLLFHYVKFGLNEGRPGNATLATYKWADYLAAYPDVAKYVNDNLASFGGSAANGAIAHYVKFGAVQGFTVPGSVPAQSIPLTTSVDSGSKFTGGAGDDTFVATSGDPAATTTAPTLTAGDSLDGGIGNDTLQLAVAANAPTPSAQISTKSIENVAITNNRGAAYTLDATLFDGVTKATFSGGTGDTTLSNTKTVVNVDLTSVNNAVTISPIASAVSGTTDVAAIALNANASSVSTTLTYNGVETLNISSNGAATGNSSNGNDFRLTITDSALKTATITGAAGARLSLTTSGATGITEAGTIDGSKATGSLDLVVAAGSSNLLSVTGGTADDRVTVGALTKEMTVVGGAGTDTIVVSSAAKPATGVTAAGTNVSGFEVLEVASGGSASFAAFPSSTFTSVTAKGTATIADVGTAALVINATPATAGGTITATRATNGAADVATVNLNATTSGTYTGVSVANEDTITISSGGDGANTITTLTATDAKSLTVTGARGLTVTDALTSTGLATLDASGNTGTVFNVNAGASTVAMTVKGSGGAPTGNTVTLNTITTGSGNDNVTGSAWIDNLTTGAGNDTISAGAGNDIIDGGTGNDTIDAGEGDNNVTAGAGNDSVTAGAGNDTIDAGSGIDTVNAGAGDDRIALSTLTDNHSLVGGTGSDRLSTATGTITATSLAAATFINTTESVAPKMSSIDTAYIRITEGSSTSTTPQTLDLTGSTGMGTLFLAINDALNDGFVRVTKFDGTAITLYGATSGANQSETKSLSISGNSQAALAITLEDYDTAATTDTFTVTGVQGLTIAGRATSQFSGAADQTNSLGVVKADTADSLTISTSGSAAANTGALTIESVSASQASTVRLTAGANDVLKITAAGGLATASSLVSSFTATSSSGGRFDIDKLDLGTSTLTTATITIGEAGAMSTDGDTTVAHTQLTDVDAGRIVTLTTDVGASAVAGLDLSGIEITTATFATGSSGTTVLRGSLGLAGKAGSFTFTGRGDVDFDTGAGAINNTVALAGTTVVFSTSGLSTDADNLVVNSSATLGATITTTLGADSITGGAGNDTINPGVGADIVRGGAGNDSITLTENASTSAADVLDVRSVVGTSSESARNTVTGNNNDTGQDSITGFDYAVDTILVTTTNVANYVHSTDSVLGTATGDVNDGSVGSFTASTLILNLDKTLGVLGNDAGDIVLSFASTTNNGVAVTTPTIANYQGRIQYNLTGSTSNDTITTGVLVDTITGGTGSDTLVGGAGSDVYNYTATTDGSTTPGSGDKIATAEFVSGADSFSFANAAFGTLGVGALTAAATTAFDTDQATTLTNLVAKADSEVYRATFTGTTFNAAFYDALDAAVTAGTHTGAAFFVLTNGVNTVVLYDADTNATAAGSIVEIATITGATTGIAVTDLTIV